MRAVLLLTLLGASSWAGEAFGVWKLSPGRSTLAADQKSVTLRIERHARGEVFTLDTVAADGRTSTLSTILYFDGKPRAFQDSACTGTQTSRRLDDGVVEIVRDCKPGSQIRLVRRVEGPGVLVFEITQQSPDGQRVIRRLVLEKR